MTSLLEIVENEDIFQRQVLPYLSIFEFVRLQSVSKKLGPATNTEICWNILCERDFGVHKKTGPEYNPETKSFDKLREYKTFNELYRRWSQWQRETCYGIKPHHAIKAIQIWSRCKKAMRGMNLTKTLESLKPPPGREFFERAAGKLPSSLLAFYAIHAGQAHLTPQSLDDEFFAGLFGSYACYSSFYSMRLIHVRESPLQWVTPTSVVIGMNLGNPRTFLVLDFGENEGPEGSMYFGYQIQTRHLVCRGGILSYFQAFTEKLEQNVYRSSIIHPDSPSSFGLCLFPENGDVVSVATTDGVEVRASARWFPERFHGAMNFGYSIRISLAANESENEDTSCQLVDRNWEFHYEDGTINRVHGEGVTGKQPILFRKADGTTGYIDMGPAGTGETILDTTFVYQSQSGPVPGTSSRDVAKTNNACVRGTFSFCPGSIDKPTGPLFFVTVGEFPLRVNLPFY